MGSVMNLVVISRTSCVMVAEMRQTCVLGDAADDVNASFKTVDVFADGFAADAWVRLDAHRITDGAYNFGRLR